MKEVRDAKGKKVCEVYLDKGSLVVAIAYGDCLTDVKIPVQKGWSERIHIVRRRRTIA